MKSVPLAALVLSLMATSAMAQPRHWRDQDQNNNTQPRAEQPRPQPQRERPQQQAQPQAQGERGGGRWNRGAQAAPQAQVQPNIQERRAFVRQDENARQVLEQRSFAARAAQARQAQQQAQQRSWQGGDRRQYQGRRGDDQAQPQTNAPSGQWDGRRDGGRDRGQTTTPQTNSPSGQWDRRRDGRDGRDWTRDGRSGGGRDANHDGRTDGRDWNRDGRRDGSGDRNWTRDPNGWNRDGGRGGWDRDHHGPAVRPDWATRDGRWSRDRNRPHYDARRYQHFYNFGHRYRIAPYVFPFGFYDYSWGFGDYLPWGWYGPNYWIDDWYDYGLPPPPVGCEWVRVGSDAILIDTFDGRVLSVARALFW